VNGVTTKYHLVGDKVTFETNGTDKIYYTYDSSGMLLSMNLNGYEYYYVRNVQGDIIGIHNKSAGIVASYIYDSWGKLISIKDQNGADVTNNTAHVGYKNPYRYRGYRYDTESGLYYLKSRYYNPDWGRFINADSFGGEVGALLSHNVFAYCMNNPINLSDPSGYWSILSWLSDIYDSVVDVVQDVVDFVQGVGAGIGESLTAGLYESPYTPNNEMSYSLGKIAGDAVSTIASGAATFTGGVGSIITAPTGIGAVACGAATAYGAVVTASSSANLVKDTMMFASQLKGSELDAAASELGFQKTGDRSHGQPVYQHKKRKLYITPDVDGHNGGVWKMADSIKNLGRKKTRMGAYDASLTRIGD